MSERSISSKQNPRLLLLSRGLARYRLALLDHVARFLPETVQIIAVPFGGPLWEVDFPVLKAAHKRISFADQPTRGSAVAKFNPTVVCIMEYSPLMLRELIVAKARGLPVIVFTELGNGEPKQTDVKATTRLTHRFFSMFTDGQVALAPSACQPIGAPWRPVCFAPHSIDTHEFSPRSSPRAPNQKCTLLCVAQYNQRKGQDLLAHALARAIREHKVNFELRLIGVHDDQWLNRVLCDANIRDHSVILGVKTGADLLHEYQKADLFVLASRFDTYGVVTQEAAACGLPLIISRFAGSSRNLVEEGKNGHVIDPYDTLAFAEVLANLINSPQRWPALGAYSRLLAERFCVRRIGRDVAEWLKPWLELQVQQS